MLKVLYSCRLFVKFVLLISSHVFKRSSRSPHFIFLIFTFPKTKMSFFVFQTESVMGSTGLHSFSSNQEKVLQTWAKKTSKWAAEEVLLLGSLPQCLPKHLNELSSIFCQNLVSSLKSFEWTDEPRSISRNLRKLLQNFTSDSSLDPCTIVGLSIASGQIFVYDEIAPPILQLFVLELMKDISFPGLVYLLSPGLAALSLQIDPSNFCNPTQISKANVALKKILFDIHSKDLSCALSRALFVQWSRVAYWLAVMGAIDGNSDFFSTAFKFLFCVNYNTSWCTTSLPCFSVLPLFGVLRRTLSELDDLTSLSVTQIYQKNLEEVTQICTSVASNLVQPKLASICVCLFDRLLILSVHQAGLSAEQVAELVLFSVPVSYLSIYSFCLSRVLF
uniref:Origin recognition complex subunit 3 n=1 Tax=Mesocestoides corti TaxID=53468 RepID=A0A5K3FWY2_MESCO